MQLLHRKLSRKNVKGSNLNFFMEKNVTYFVSFIIYVIFHLNCSNATVKKITSIIFMPCVLCYGLFGIPRCGKLKLKNIVILIPTHIIHTYILLRMTRRYAVSCHNDKCNGYKNKQALQ